MSRRGYPVATKVRAAPAAARSGFPVRHRQAAMEQGEAQVGARVVTEAVALTP